MMTKKLIATSAIITGILGVLFVLVFGSMLLFYRSSIDYSQAIIGNWTTEQYYLENKAYKADEDNYQVFVIDVNEISANGTILGDFEGSYTINSGVHCIVDCVQDIDFTIDFNSRGQMRLTFTNGTTLLLSRDE